MCAFLSFILYNPPMFNSSQIPEPSHHRHNKQNISYLTFTYVYDHKNINCNVPTSNHFLIIINKRGIKYRFAQSPCACFTSCVKEIHISTHSRTALP